MRYRYQSIRQLKYPFLFFILIEFQFEIRKAVSIKSVQKRNKQIIIRNCLFSKTMPLFYLNVNKENIYITKGLGIETSFLIEEPVQRVVRIKSFPLRSFLAKQSQNGCFKTVPT